MPEAKLVTSSPSRKRRGTFRLRCVSAGSALVGLAVLIAADRAPADPIRSPERKGSASGSASDAKPYEEHVRPFLTRHCQECHGGDKPEGKFFLDRLTSDFDNKKNLDQ